MIKFQRWAPIHPKKGNKYVREDKKYVQPDRSMWVGGYTGEYEDIDR